MRLQYIDLELTVVDKKTGLPLKGQTFVVSNKQGTKVDTLTSSDSGRIEFTFSHSGYCFIGLFDFRAMIYPHKKLKIIFSSETVSFSIKIRHKYYDYLDDESPPRKFSKTIKIKTAHNSG